MELFGLRLLSANHLSAVILIRFVSCVFLIDRCLAGGQAKEFECNSEFPKQNDGLSTIISRNNQTVPIKNGECDGDEFVPDPLLSTVCVNNTKNGRCYVLLELYWSLGTRARELVTEIKVTLLRVEPTLGMWFDVSCHSRENVGDAQWPGDLITRIPLRFDCCNTMLQDEKYSIDSQAWNDDSKFCLARTTLDLKAQPKTSRNNEVRSWGDDPLANGSRPLVNIPSSTNALALTNVAVVIGVLSVCAVISGIVFYLLCVKNRRSCFYKWSTGLVKKTRPGSRRPEDLDEQKLSHPQGYKEQCHCEHCIRDRFVKNFIPPPNSDFSEEVESDDSQVRNYRATADYCAFIPPLDSDLSEDDSNDSQLQQFDSGHYSIDPQTANSGILN